ncbi:hypothetical protein BG24_1474 [Burkholderia pseudomallei PB08298010]|nr:hypothetical protein BG24_1474 [Burkholderia pseudomallei PB08298010]
MTADTLDTNWLRLLCILLPYYNLIRNDQSS